MACEGVRRASYVVMPVRGSVSYDEFRQRVRRYRRSDVLRAVAALAVQMDAAERGSGQPPRLPEYVRQFSLAGVARTCLIAGNDHRNDPFSINELAALCGMYLNIHDPALDQESSTTRLRQLMSRIAYEQFGFQYSLSEELGRPLPLLLDHVAYCPGAPSEADWERALRVPLAHFMRVGFALHVAIMSNGGSIARSLLQAPHVAPVFEPLSTEEALDVADRLFIRTPEEHAAWGRDREEPRHEKWSPNPLRAAPLVLLGADVVGPIPRFIVDRITLSGLYFIGLEAFGPALYRRSGMHVSAVRRNALATATGSQGRRRGGLRLAAT